MGSIEQLVAGRGGRSSGSASAEGCLLTESTVGHDVGLVTVGVESVKFEQNEEQHSRQTRLVDTLGRFDRLVEGGGLQVNRWSVHEL